MSGLALLGTRPGVARRRMAWHLVTWAGAALALGGCSDLLDVENPATIGDSDVRTAESVDLWANGTLLSVQKGWDNMLVLVSTASDELRFRGPHQWWGQIDRGWLSDPNNGGIVLTFPAASSAHWMAREAVSVLDSLYQAGELADPAPLIRVLFYGAIAHATLPDALADYAPSDRTEAGPALGSANMASLYDTAVAYVDRALSLNPDAETRRDLTAMRARARFARSVWQRVRPPPADRSGGGYVADAQAVQDALSALAVDPSDWRFQFSFPYGIVGSTTRGMACFGNLSLGDRYQSPAKASVPEAVPLLDPIDAIPDPWLEVFVLTEWVHDGACENLDLTVFSAREMHLIVAEDALSRGDTATFAEHVNAVRAFESLTPWTLSAGVDARDLLIYERQTQLFLMGRRLADLYRFGQASDTWDPASEAATMPGTLFPIPATEVEANCYLNGSCS